MVEIRVNNPNFTKMPSIRCDPPINAHMFFITLLNLNVVIKENLRRTGLGLLIVNPSRPRTKVTVLVRTITSA